MLEIASKPDTEDWEKYSPSARVRITRPIVQVADQILTRAYPFQKPFQPLLRKLLNLRGWKMSKWLFRKQLISERWLATVDMQTMSRSNAGIVIRRLRQAAGLSQSDLARRLNVHQAHLSRLESGGRRLVRETIREVKAAIRASLKERQAAVARLIGSKK